MERAVPLPDARTGSLHARLSPRYFEDVVICACRLHSDTEESRRFADSMSAQFFITHPGNFDVNVDVVQQRTRDPLLIFGYDRSRASASLLAIPIISAWTGIHRCDQLKVS